MRRWLPLLTTFALALGCGHGQPMHPPPAGSFYVVQAGETLTEIARRQSLPVEDLAEINGLPVDAPLAPGQVVFVLGPQGVVPASSPDILPPSVLADQAPPGEGDEAGDQRLAWPLQDVVISSSYGRRWGRKHEGIDLAARKGTPVLAARAGLVLYASDKLGGYGKMVVLQHDGDLLTAYAHNSSLLVREGDKVRAGQMIARVGQTGRASAPHLHFEVRRGQIPQDPLRYLPRR
jgi:murein DD-endopeptidase MepM/ murein hydrolase activator NlpD